MVICLKTNSDFFFDRYLKEKELPQVSISVKIEITHQLPFWRDVEPGG